MIDSMYTVGEFAEKMKVSVRTLQYYDKQGLLKPSSHSEGGRRRDLMLKEEFNYTRRLEL